VPICIGQFDSLKTLNLSSNRLVSLPDSLCDIASLADLNVSTNLLRTLPERIGNLQRLRALDVSHNQLQSLPLSLADCTKLIDIKAAGNALLCPASDIVARGAAHVRVFLSDLQRNQQRVSRSVRLVLLGDAQTGRTALARALISHRIGARWRQPHGPAARSTGLTVQEVVFDRARDADEPLAVLSDAAAAVAAGGASLLPPSISAHAAPLSPNSLTTESLSSGEPGSGRDDEVLDEHDVATGRNTRFFVWDFAPDFYAQLHGPLSSEQQITIVTWRLRDTRTGSTPLAWLHSLAQAIAARKARGESMQKVSPDGAVVVLVGTYADEAPLAHDTDLINGHMQQIADELARMPELTRRINVKCILSVSSVDGTGIEELQRTLMELAPSVRQWHTEVPASWRAFEAALTDSSHRRLPIISLAAAERVAALCGVEREDVARCLRHLHGLGRVLHFDTPRGNLRSRLMLDPLYLYNVAHHFGAMAPAQKHTSASVNASAVTAATATSASTTATSTTTATLTTTGSSTAAGAAAAAAAPVQSSKTAPLISSASTSSKPSDDDQAAAFRPRTSTDGGVTRFGGAELSQARLDADLRRYAEASRPWLQIVLQHVNLLLTLAKPTGEALSGDAPSAIFMPSLGRNQPPATMWPLTAADPQKVLELRRFHALEIASDAVLVRFLQRVLQCSSLHVVWLWQRGVLFNCGDSAPPVQFFVELSWDKRVLQQSVRWTADSAQAERDAAPSEKLNCHKCSRPVGADGIEALNAFWCATCFVCTSCMRPLTGDFLQVGGVGYCSQQCWQTLHPDDALPEAPQTPRLGASGHTIAERATLIDENALRRAGLESELAAARERRASIVEQLAAAAGRFKAQSKRNSDLRMTKLLAAMKQDLVECEAEINVLDRQLRTVAAATFVAKASSLSGTASAGETTDNDDDVSVSPTPSIRLTGNRLVDSKSPSGRSNADSSGGDDPADSGTALRRMSSSRRELQRASNKRPSIDSSASNSGRGLNRSDAYLSRRVTPVREARAPLVVPDAVVDGLRLVVELLEDSFDDIDGDATCAVCCTTCMRVLPARVHKFLFAEVLAALLVNGPNGSLTCQYGHAPRINDLVPDYCLTDVDKHLPLLPDANSAIASGKQEIGRGAFGTIFRAVLNSGVRNVAAGAVVAIKELIVLPEASVTQRVQVLLEFRTELLAMQRAGRNECLVGALAFATVPSLSLFMELAVGGTLQDALHLESLELPWVVRTRIALDVSRGLAHMHRSSPALLHRDLKSPNVLLARALPELAAGASDKAPLAKVADFGTCCAYRGVALSHRIVDQPRWLAPEVMQLAGYGLASDIFSLGVTLWEIATREEPWDEFKYGSFTSQLERDCIAGRRPTIPGDNAVPPAFAAVIRACWASQSSHRPTAEGVCGQLEAFIAGRQRPPLAVEDEGSADWSRDSLLRCQLHSTPFVTLAIAPLRAVVAWIGDIEVGTIDERDVLLRAMYRTRPDVAARVELLQAQIAWAQRVPPELADASLGAQRRERERRRGVLVHALHVWFTACPDHFQRATPAAAADVADNALLQLVGTTLEQLAAAKVANEPPKVIADLQEAFAGAKASRARTTSQLPRVGSKTIKSLWLPTMPVDDLANELTLLEHGFMREIEFDALLAWRAEHATRARSYGDASPRESDDAVDVGSIVTWIEWSRRMVDWVVTEVLAPELVQGRADAITKFVQVAQHCATELRNFNTAFQVVAALSLPTITSLKRTWAAVTPKVRADLDALAALLSPAGAAKQYREALAVRGKSNARVPLLNVLLSDLGEMCAQLEKSSDFLVHSGANTTMTASLVPSSHVTPRGSIDSPSPRSSLSSAAGGGGGSGERHKRHKEGGKRRHKRKGDRSPERPELPAATVTKTSRRRHGKEDADDVIASTLAPPKLPDMVEPDGSSEGSAPPPLPPMDPLPAAAASASASATTAATAATAAAASTVAAAAATMLDASQRSLSRRLTRDVFDPVIDVQTTTQLATLLRSFGDWSGTAFDTPSRNDVRMLLMSVEVWPRDTQEEIARLREPDSMVAATSGDSDAVMEAHASLPAALRADLARLRCLLRCHASVVVGMMPTTTCVVMSGSFPWQLARGRVPSLCILASGTMERRRDALRLSSHTPNDALPMLGIDALAGLRCVATAVATDDVGLHDVPLGFLFACLAADSGLERAFYHGVAESLALRFRALVCDGVATATAPEPSAAVIEQATRDGIAAAAAAAAAATAQASPSAALDSSSLSNSTASVRQPSPPPTAPPSAALASSSGAAATTTSLGTQPSSLGGMRDKLRSLGTILRRNKTESPSESFSISAPSTFKHVEMSLDDLRTAAVVATVSQVTDDVRKRVVDSATNDLVELFGAELQPDEVVVRAYKCRSSQKRKGTLFITPLAVYFFSKSLAQSVRRRLSLFDEGISVVAPPTVATSGPEVALLGERFAFANPALRDEALALLRALALPGALAISEQASASSSSVGSVGHAALVSSVGSTSSTARSSFSLDGERSSPGLMGSSSTSSVSKLQLVRDAVAHATASSPVAPPSPAALAQMRVQAVRSTRRTRRLAERELPLRRCISEGDAVGASLVASDEWESLLRGSRTLQLAQGARVVKEGDSNPRLYVVKTGRVRLERGEGAAARVLGAINAGETFGTVEWLLSCAALTSAIVDSPAAEVHVLSVSFVDKLLLLQPSTASHLYQLVALHLMALVRTNEVVLAAPEAERVAMRARLAEVVDGVPFVLSSAFDAPAHDSDANDSSVESSDSSGSSTDSIDAMEELLADNSGANPDDSSSSGADAAIAEMYKSHGGHRRRKKGSEKTTTERAEKTRRKHRSSAVGVSTTSRTRKHKK
jgi:CRP-like cAMP-binding protein